MLGCQVEFIPLLSQGGQLLVSAEICPVTSRALLASGLCPWQGAGRCFERPAQRLASPVLRNPVEDATRFGLLSRFIAEKGVFKGYVPIRWIKPHRFRKLIASSFVFVDLEQRVGQVLTDGGSVGCELDRLLECRDSLVILSLSKCVVGMLKKPVGGVGLLRGGGL
jgi:hypothetical protein